MTYGNTELQWLPISKCMIDGIFNSPEKSMELHHLLCSFVPGGQSISQSRGDSEETEVGSFTEAVCVFYIHFSHHLEGIRSPAMSHSAILKEEVGVEEPC